MDLGSMEAPRTAGMLCRVDRRVSMEHRDIGLKEEAGRAQLSVGAWGEKPQNSKARTVGHHGRITNFVSFFEARLH